MDEWRIIEELERLHEWDPDAVCDALNITTSELLDHPVRCLFTGRLSGSRRTMSEQL
jgi:hypothetical protein